MSQSLDNAIRNASNHGVSLSDAYRQVSSAPTSLSDAYIRAQEETTGNVSKYNKKNPPKLNEWDIKTPADVQAYRLQERHARGIYSIQEKREAIRKSDEERKARNDKYYAELEKRKPGAAAGRALLQSIPDQTQDRRLVSNKPLPANSK